MDRTGGFWDGRGARLMAAVVLAAALAGLGYYNRELMFPPSPVAGGAASGNPQLLACLKERIGAVDRMRAEGVVNEAQHGQFRERAEAFCIGQFGEGGPPPPPN